MTMSTATEPQTGRRARSDGDRSRQRILEAAAQLATVQGLDRLSIGELAAHIGMSKSGLYAHFRSKEELQLATIDAAEAIFDEVVVGPMHDAEPGIPAVLALCRCVPRPPRGPVFPGGCFFACASAEIQSRPGPVKERIAEFDGRWRGHSRTTCGSPRRPATWPDEDIDQVVFELDAYLLYAHAAFGFRGDPRSWRVRAMPSGGASG